MTAKKLLKKTGKIFLYMLGFVLFILVAAIIFLNTDYAKKLIRDKAAAYLQNKIKTKVEIGSIDYSLPRSIEIRNVYIEDQQKDTLLYGELLSVNLNMLKLISGEIYISKVELKNIKATISRTENDSNYNFQFIVDAFSNKDEKKKASTDTSAMKITLKEFIVNGFVLQYKDKYGGNEFSTAVKNLDITVNKFQPDKLLFAIGQFKTNGLDFSMQSYKTIHSTLSPTEKDTVKNNLQLTANKLDLNNINVSMQNNDNGMYYANQFRHLIINNTIINMALQKVSLDKMALDSSSVKFIAAAPQQNEIKDTSVSSSAWIVSVKSLELNNDAFQFDNNQSPQQKEGFDPAHINLQHIQVNTGDIFYSTDSTKATINQLAFNDKSGFKLDTTHAKVLYSAKGFSAAELYIKTPKSIIQNALQLHYDDIAQLTTKPENTSVAASLSKTTIAVNDIYMLMPSAKKYLPVDKFHDNVININTEIKGTLQQLNIPLLQLSGLSGSTVNAKAILYNITDSQRLAYDITVYNTHFLRNDLSKFLPANNNYLGELPPDISFNTHVKGDMKNSVVDIDVNSTSFKLKGKADIKNIKNPKALKYDVVINEGSVQKNFITGLIPANTIPSSIQLPDVILMKGSLKGDMNNITPNLTLGGSYGTVSAKGYVYNFKNKEAAKYDIQFAAKDFAAGKFLKQDSVLGNITLSASAKGTGFNYKTMHSSLSIHVDDASIKQYNYKDITLGAELSGGNITSAGNINDSNLQMHYTASANVSGEYPAMVDAGLILDTVQLEKLHLYDSTLNASFRANIKANSLDPKNLNASVIIDSARVNVKNKPYYFDSITTKAISNNGDNDIALKSPLTDIFIKGKFDYDKVGQSILQYIDKYYDIISTPAQNLPPQQVTINGIIKKHPLIIDLVPGLTYEDIKFDGGFSSGGGDSALKLKVFIPKLSYLAYAVDNGKIDIASLNNEIDYNVSFDMLHFNKNIFYASSIKGDVANDSLNITALTKDEHNKDQFGIGAAITSKDKSYTLSLKNDLLLNHQKWNVSADNKISYSPQGILIKDFSIESNKAKISANSQGTINSPIDINIENFEIKDIASIANSDTLLASGVINGKINVSGFDKKLPAFTGGLAIDSFQFMQQPVGNIKFAAKEEDANTITASFGLTGNGNTVNAKGNYQLNNTQNQFDADLNIQQLNMATVQAFTAGNMSRSSGTISGDIKLDGNFNDPHWNGAVNFDTAKFTVVKTGTAYTIDKQKITFAYPVISFEQFTIKDSAENELSLDGKITARSLTAYDMNVDINADNFTLVNTPQALDNQVYGFASTDANITVAGTTTSPDIDGDISLNPKSNVTLVLPEQNANKDAAREVVRFIDRDTFQLPEKIGFSPEVEQKADVTGFLNYNLNINISKEAALTVIVDPSSGDELKVKGEAQLNAGVDPGGHIVLAGNYELNSGHYVLNYEFLQRQFNLLKGSTIAFSGNPTDAQVNITAEYIANTSASDLLENEISDLDPKTANTYNQKIPFRVLLYLKGDMKKPQISFDIQLPDENSNVPISNQLRSTIENKLAQMRNDATVTNKEVFSLLLLGHFVGEQSSDFFKSNGASTSLNEVARESVSKFLSSALNEIAADLFKGVDVDLNLNSYQDYSSGDQQQRTDLNVAVSKNFLDNRLTVTAGKNFGVEGQDAAAKSVQQNASASSFPDVTLNYKLTSDGKYLLRAYKKDQFDVTVDGYVTETGVAFVLTFDFDTFKELFQKNKEKKKKPAKQ